MFFKSFFRGKSLDGGGERVDINYFKMKLKDFDIYQLSHYHRYKFAQKYVGSDCDVADFACGTGYGTMMMAEKAKSVTGMDLNADVVKIISDRYKKKTSVRFLNGNLLDIDFENKFDLIVSFETIEHFAESDIVQLLKQFQKALKKGGQVIFSTPYNQEMTEGALKMGFHLTYHIVESTVAGWMKEAGFEVEDVFYQNYSEHEVVKDLDKKEFLLVVGRKSAS